MAANHKTLSVSQSKIWGQVDDVTTLVLKASSLALDDSGVTSSGTLTYGGALNVATAKAYTFKSVGSISYLSLVLPDGVALKAAAGPSSVITTDALPAALRPKVDTYFNCRIQADGPTHWYCMGVVKTNGVVEIWHATNTYAKVGFTHDGQIFRAGTVTVPYVTA
jgi:hypothetical protein